jgi:hypothetical protein
MLPVSEAGVTEGMVVDVTQHLDYNHLHLALATLTDTDTIYWKIMMDMNSNSVAYVFNDYTIKTRQEFEQVFGKSSHLFSSHLILSHQALTQTMTSNLAGPLIEENINNIMRMVPQAHQV